MCTDKNFMQLLNENKLRLDATYAFIKYSKLYRNLDLTISNEPSSNADIITTYPQWKVIAGINEELNAFQHAYASAIIAYHYNQELAIALGVRRVGKNELPTIYKISETTYQIDNSDLMSVNNNA